MKSDRTWDLAWIPHVFAMELKRVFSYRVDFWVQFLLGTGTEMVVAYFLWRSIFAAKHVQTMQGFSFHGIVYYYLFATFAYRIVRGADRGYLSDDIYQGGLTKYLLYPVPYLGYKFVTHISWQIIGMLQLALGFALFACFFGLPHEQAISWTSFLLGLATCFFAGYLHFIMTCCLELVAFWQDIIWNLVAMFRFISTLLGGAMVPLAFFPEWGRHAVAATPFPLLIAFPVNAFMGHASVHEWCWSLALLLVWAMLFTALAVWVWGQGLKRYTGVGI